ncbi:DUF2059 domain-containing protein [Aliiroseovarius crassostreae]|uniref:DUF2059 domain-containing protein n=1 Tax=Aliiroseovarius crassostreae TaxID=154981 RepID=UPI002200BC8E|nr:DUF2059 domain-containing protein [Aliiroseovarius crassostreae]UWQ05878.1 hypothetical protein K3X22_05435 [Aliiroseovarius crassostreae]
MFQRVLTLILPLFLVAVSPAQTSFAQGSELGADRDKIREFLEVTGFDVAIASIQQGAMAGPALTGAAPDQFGRNWVRLAEQVFAPDKMVDDAVDMIEAVMPADLLDHGVVFYGSDLGKRVVAVENESHMVEDAIRQTEGEKLVDELLEDRSPRLDVFKAMSQSVGSTDVAIRSIVEIQVRYLMAAAAAGATDLEIGEEDLRGMLMAQQGEMRRSIEVHGLVANAYTYRSLSDQELIDYLSALQSPQMMQVYEILNAVQYEIMADRYERLATQLGRLQPESEL